jgi:hypothetical protein
MVAYLRLFGANLPQSHGALQRAMKRGRGRETVPLLAECVLNRGLRSHSRSVGPVR